MRLARSISVWPSGRVVTENSTRRRPKPMKHFHLSTLLLLTVLASAFVGANVIGSPGRDNGRSFDRARLPRRLLGMAYARTWRSILVERLGLRIQRRHMPCRSSAGWLRVGKIARRRRHD